MLKGILEITSEINQQNKPRKSMGHIPLSLTLIYSLVSNYLGSKIWTYLLKYHRYL